MDTQFNSAQIRRIVLHRLESLNRSGVTYLRRFPAESLTIGSLPADSPVLSESTDGETHAGIVAVPDTTIVREEIAPPLTVQQEAAMPKAKASPIDRTAALASIQKDVIVCQRCSHLACSRTQTVFGVGTHRPRLCFLGEAPGADEDRLGEPFVGRAGQLLTDIIQKGMGLTRSDVYILNVLKCRPPDNRTPTEEEIENCREYFERQLQVLKPEFICCLGSTAVRALLRDKTSIGRLRGQWFDYQGARVMITYHPSYLLRNPAAKKDTWQDIQMLMREMGLPIRESGSLHG
jgi:DNA polymerase